jgi:hypothetical protein
LVGVYRFGASEWSVHIEMKTDRRINMAIASGERNQEAMELIRNWCRHARVKKMGGIGIVEAQTGLPIGPHAMACDYAAANGLAMWDLGDAALDFHDRNCVGCTHRAPVGLPNLSKLIGERDRARAEYAREEERRREDLTARHTARKARRANFRAGLPALAAIIIDHVDELDGPDPKDAAARILGTVKLAPDTFEPSVVSYFFELLEAREAWFYDTGLQVIHALNIEPERLTRCAMQALADSRGTDEAAEIVEEHAALVDSAQIPSALPALIECAYPRRSPMQQWVISRPSPLLALYRAHPQDVERALGALIDHARAYFVSVGARGITFLAEVDASLPCRFDRSLLARLVRGRDLREQEFSSGMGDEGVVAALREAIEHAFEGDPEETDDLAVQFLASASGDDEAQIYKVYEGVLHGRRRRDRTRPADAADRTALRRLLAAANQTNSYEVLQELHGAFSYVAEELITLAREELPNILGAVLMLSDKIGASEGSPIIENDPVSAMERGNICSQRTNLQNALVNWAAEAAGGDSRATAQYLDVLSSIREEHAVLRARLTEEAHRLMRTPEGLIATLPPIYSALFGTSVRVRAAAAAAIGKLDGKTKGDLPRLVYEALVAQLTDSYVMVHQSAFEALERIELPDSLEQDARGAVMTLILTYHQSRKDDRFLLDCICRYLERFTTDAEKAWLSDLFLEIVAKLKADELVEERWRLSRQFRDKPRFADVWVRVLEEAHALRYREDDLIETLNSLPGPEIYRHRARLEKLGNESDSWTLPRRLIESLTRSGAWLEAVHIAERVYARIPDTVEMRARKLFVNQYRIATRFEAAIAAGQMEELKELAQAWRRNEHDIEADRLAHERRRRPFPHIPDPH